MQLRGKKIGIISTLFVYFVSFFLQSNFLFFQARAAEKNIPRVNIVAILVDDKIYNPISKGLIRYASNYVQGKLSDTKALVMPLNLDNISAYDIHRMMENIYFDGLEDVNSSLVGLIMVGDIPLPVVNQDGYIFPTVYPYVDFENQKYVWDSESKYFVPNGNIGGQAEIWHGLINYGDDVDAYSDFFEKIERYVADPDHFIGDSMWYEDIIASKEGFLDQTFPYYRNKIMFGEDIGYQRYSPLMRKMFSNESIDDSFEIVGELEGVLGTTFSGTDSDVLEQMKSQKDNVHSSKLVEQEIETSYLADYNELFSKNNLSLMRENIFAGGRWIKNYENSDGDMVQVADADTSASMIQLKDTMYLGNENMVGLIQNLNDLMEEMIDEKINNEKYSMDIVLPLGHKHITGKRILFKCYSFVDYYENFYFGENARNVESAKDLTIYRGTYRNLTGLEGLTYEDLLVGNNAVVSDYDKTDVKLKSIGASYDIFSNQVEGNRGYMMTRVDGDLDIYDDNKTAKKASTENPIGIVRRKVWPEICKDKALLKKNQCEEFGEFAKRWRGGASTINLISDSVASGRYALSGYRAIDSWRSIYDMGGFQSLQQGKDEGMSGKGWIDGMGAGPQWAANSFKAYMKYSSPTQREYWEKKLIGYVIGENNTPDVHTGFKYLNYWELRDTNPNLFNNGEFTKQSAKVFDIYYYPDERIKGCQSTEKYSYKFISSVIKHDSTSLGEINGIEYDRYGDNGQLGKYYEDIMAAHVDLNDDMNDINATFGPLIDTINGINRDIYDLIRKLNGEVSDLSSDQTTRGAKEGERSRLNASLDGLAESARATDAACSDEHSDWVSCESCVPTEDKSCRYCGSDPLDSYTCRHSWDAYNDAVYKIGVLDGEISALRADEERLEGIIANFLSQVPSRIDDEDRQVEIMYKLVMGLFLNNIIGAMEYVANIEGLDPQCIYSGCIDDSLKIGFLPSWIDNIHGMWNKFVQNKDSILKNYSDMYNLLVAQRTARNNLRSRILSISKRGTNHSRANSIADQIDEVFVVHQEKNEDNDGTDYTLTSTSAAEEMDVFMESFEEMKQIFSNLIKQDTDGPQVLAGAREDSEFLKWAVKNAEKKGIDLENISDGNLITLYALRAKGDGYESVVANGIQDVLRRVTKHMSGMNILTPDRPVDSPRYVSMQSVAGNEIKLIYPNLFKVEVFELTGSNRDGYDIHKLMGTGEIKKSLIKYLNGKVEEYNTILKKEQESASATFASKYQYFQKLLDLDKLATPTTESSVRPYNYFTYDEFVEALGGEEMLDVVADILYYQSLTNKTKLSTLGVAYDIQLIKDSFNLNDKREQTLRDYLIEGNDDNMNPLLVIPNYEPYGYEVAFVNSNGKDYIIPSDLKEESEIQSILDSFSESSNVRHQPTQQEQDLNDECNILSNGRLPIFKLQGLKATSPWFDGFKCWLRHLTGSVKVNLTFDHSLGDVVVGSGFTGFINSITDGSLTQWGDQMTKYADDLNTLISAGTGYDSDKNNTQLAVNAEMHNNDVINGDGEVANAMLNLSRNLKISSSSSRLASYQYTGSNPFSILKIGSAANVGRVNVSIVSTGDGCLQLDNHNLCNEYSFSFNPKTEPFTGLVSSYDHIAGSVALDIKVSIGGEYIERVIKYTVNPGELDHVEMKFGSKPTFAGMITPVEVVGYDIYNNRVSWTLDRYKFTASTGRFLKDGAYSAEFTTNDFRNLNFYYQAPENAQDGDEAIIQILKVGDVSDFVETYHQPIAWATPEVSFDGKILLSKGTLKNKYSMKLTDNESIYSNDGSLNVSKLHKIDVDMKNIKGSLVDIDSQIVVTSQKGFVVVGQLQQKDGKSSFFPTSKNYISGGHVTVYYYPTTVAGDDVINIDIPGLKTHIINLSIQPAEWYKTEIIPENDVINIGDTTHVELYLSDVWGNLMPGNNPLTLCYDDEKIEFAGYSPNDNGCLNLEIQEGYIKLDAVGVGGGVTYINADSGSLQMTIDKNIFPHEFDGSGLNIMYLNYFGNDWGNQWGYFSDNDNYIESLMKKSGKIITTTTQLVSEDKIKKMLWKIEPGFRVWNPGNLSTILTLRGKQGVLSVGGISDMNFILPDAEWKYVNEDTMYTIVNTKSSQNFIFFFPSSENYSVKDGILYDGDKEIINLLGGEVSLQLGNYPMNNGDNSWNVVVQGVNYGKLVIHIPSFKVNIDDFSLPIQRYVLSPTFMNGSTDNLESVGIFDNQSNFELQSTYKSIQNSDEIKENIGFLGDFKNITLFGEGEIIGEATKKFGSEFVINLGDPVLSRKGLNDTIGETNFDGGIGQEIFVDSENQIFGTYEIDFNNDSLKDLLVVYLDGRVKLSKNYGGTPDFRNMQELMRIAIAIKELFVGDVDGNGYDDIIIYTSNNQLRVYLNNDGIFDVDGNVACLNLNVHNGEVSSTPSDLSNLYNVFVEDMNQDKIMDIVTYDRKGYIKIFYGGNTNGWANYLSTEKYGCDAGWYDRESYDDNTQIITALGLSIVGDKVTDNSMLRWIGMGGETVEIKEDDLSKYGIDFNEDALSQSGMIETRTRGKDGSIDGIMNGIMNNFDTLKAAEALIADTTKFQEVTLYDTSLVHGDGNTYTFVPVSYLDVNNKEDYGISWKNYSIKNGGEILSDGDIVTVRVTIQATQNFWGSYGDVIQGPRKLYYDEHNIMKGIRFIQNQKNAVIKQRDGGFAFIVDNILLNAGETMVFEYDLEYYGTKVKNIDLTYDTWWSPGVLPDIKIFSVDGCDKNFYAYVNHGQKSFSYEEIDLQGEISKVYENAENNTEDFAQDVVEAGSDVNKLPGIVSDKLERISLLGSLILGEELEISDDEEGKNKLKNAMLQKIEERGLESLNMNLNLNLSIFEGQSDAIEKVIDDVTKGMCNGFSFGGNNNCPGLPVPFNQAFLAPGKYHLFGCWDLPLEFLEGGVPSFFFPSSLPPYPVIPIPWGMKGPGDDFFWPLQGGEYPSLVRIYAVPTLTAQLGIGICFGPYATSKLFVSPFGDIAGNCIVFAIKPQCKSTGKASGDMPNETYNPIVEDVRDSGTCVKTQKGPYGYNPSPFNFKSYKSTVTENGYVDYSVNANYGFIELETSAFIGDDDYNNTQNSIMVGDVDILGGSFTINKIRGGIMQGIREAIIDKWLDPQIRYIANQLTRMHVEVKWPDLSGVLDEVGSLKDVVQEVKNQGRLIGNEGQEFGNQVKKVGGDAKQGVKNVYSGVKSRGVVDYAKSKWEGSSYQSLNEFNDYIANPFESLASLMNKSNIINISMEPVTVKVPWIFPEDINAYSVYLNQRVSTNEITLSKWAAALSTFSGSCENEPTDAQRQACYDKAASYWNSFIEFQQFDRPKMLDQIYTNLRILQEYRDFPFEVYEWIHVIDRYMSEISSLINNTLGYLSYWVSTNAERYVGYVDAIILIMNIIKTYQLIIDFSVEWSENCGNCARDTYDQYSCKLSFLCDLINLPILQIPNFKLPNITLDLTNIDLGLDIVLPEFNFQTVRIDLPDFPNLPEPPSISANIKLFDLPDIPKLPEPPDLPELPSFIPEVELELPLLPPAPELPKIPNTIETTIKAVKLIGKIYCIVKGGFGLVGEKSVKAKIEEITERTYSVNWIDKIMDYTNRTAAPIKNYGVDYEISSYVDLQFNFSDFYDYLNALTKHINNISTTSVNWANENIIDNYNQASDAFESIGGQNIDISVELTMNSDNENLNKNISLLENSIGLTSDEIEYVDYGVGKSRFEEVLTYFRNEVSSTTLSDEFNKSFDKIENQIETPNMVESNIEGLNKVKDDVMNYLDNQKSEYLALADLINDDYGGFLAMVASGYGKDSSNTGKLLTFNVQLFNLDSSTEEKVKNLSKQNPYQILLENKQNIIDGYWNAINTNTADDLGMSRSQYLVLRNNIGDMKQKVSTLYSIMKNTSPSTNLIAKNGASSMKSLLASTTRIGGNIEMALSVDPAPFSEGIYEEDTDKQLVKVVYSDSFTSHIGKKQRKTSHSKNHNILLWDTDAVYMKCLGQRCNTGQGNNRKYYKLKSTINEIPYKETWVEFDKETKLKIADDMQEVKDWEVKGQTYDILSFSWTLNGADAYLIKLVDRVDYSYEKVDYTSNKMLVRYVLALPYGIDLNELYKNKVKLELLQKTDLLKILYGKELVEVVYYDPHKTSVSVTISNIDRKRYFGRIATLKFDENKYNINSPWSNQIVAGKQIVGDDQGPIPEQQLYRPSVSSVVSEGDRLEGYVGTKYVLYVKWKDNVALDYINISQNGQILTEKYTSKIEDIISLNIDLHTDMDTETYNILGIDQFGNKTEKMIEIGFSIPDIKITDIVKTSDGKSVNVIAELSQDIDEGNVSFQRKRGESWRTMDVKSVLAGETRVLGGSYMAGNDIAMYDKDNSVVALMDPDTAEIKIQSDYKDLFDVNVKVNDNTILELYNKDTKKVVFSMRVPVGEVIKIDAGNYGVSNLPDNGKMGIFNGGKAVYKNGENVLFISPEGHLFSELGMNGEYDYDRELQSLLFTLYETSDLQKKNPLKIWVKAEPFSMN